MNEQHCEQCENRCPVDALRCNRGRAHFGLESKEPEMSGPVKLLQRCGHILHHGGIDPKNALTALTAQEQAELERLLSVLLADWQKNGSEEQLGHHHGRH